MILRKSIVLLSISMGVLGVTAAEAAPPSAALNKTITLNYTVSGLSTSPEGVQRGFNTLSTETIYVSGAGRLFVRRSMSALRSGRAKVGRQIETGPEGRSNTSFRFQGTSLIGQIGWKSGARQLTATFDPGFSSCNVSILEGRSNGEDLVRRGPSGRLNTIQSSTISNATCSIQSGNAFGG